MSHPARAVAWLFWLLFCGGAWGCGYRLAHAEPDPRGPFEVRAGSFTTPATEARIAALAGARAMLARHGQLASAGGSKDARIVIDVVRVRERAEAVSANEGALSPHARSVRLIVTGRARLQVGADTIRDTGDVDSEELVSPGADVASFELARDDAVRTAARRLGQTLVRRLLLLP